MSGVLLAQTKQWFGGKLEGLGPLGGETVDLIFGKTPKGALDLFFKVLSAIVGILTIVAAIWFVFQFFIGAIQIMTSGSDKTKMQEASGRMTQAVVGIIIVIAAIFFISLIGALTGLRILGPWPFIYGLWE